MSTSINGLLINNPTPTGVQTRTLGCIIRTNSCIAVYVIVHSYFRRKKNGCLSMLIVLSHNDQMPKELYEPMHKVVRALILSNPH